MRFAQLWDICGGGQIGGVSRPNTAPNTLILEVNGSPLFLDGMPTGACRAFEYPEEKILSTAERDVLQREIALFASVIQQKVTMRDRIRGFAHGCIGGSNALVLNGEPWYYPRKDVWGAVRSGHSCPACAPWRRTARSITPRTTRFAGSNAPR